jgi:hypothetical protein
VAADPKHKGTIPQVGLVYKGVKLGDFVHSRLSTARGNRGTEDRKKRALARMGEIATVSRRLLFGDGAA